MLIGNLGADPEVRSTSSGLNLTKFRIATTEYWTKNGNREERTEWHSIVVWGNQAEACARILSKGSKVFVEGRLQSNEYQDRDGNNRKAWEIKADRVQFLDPKRDRSGFDQGGNQGGGGGNWGNTGGGNQGGGGSSWGNTGGGSQGGGGWSSAPSTDSQWGNTGNGGGDQGGDDPIPF